MIYDPYWRKLTDCSFVNLSPFGFNPMILSLALVLRLGQSITVESNTKEGERNALLDQKGWNNSIGFPDGSSTRICLPPLPVTISLRNFAPRPFSSWTVASRSSTPS